MLGIWTFMLWCFGVSQESHHLVGGELLGRTPKTPLKYPYWYRGPRGVQGSRPLRLCSTRGKGPEPLGWFPAGREPCVAPPCLRVFK